MNEFLHSQSISQLVTLRESMHKEGLYLLEDEITAELQSRGYVDVPRVCTCREVAGDDPECAFHGEQA